MAKFCFYFGEDQDLLERLHHAAVFCWGEVEETITESFHLFVATNDSDSALYSTGKECGALSGYVAIEDKGGHVDQRDSLEEFFSEIVENVWPLGDEWAGSFAAVLYSSEKREVTLCNDIIGHFPLYYATIDGGEFVGGTSLIALSRSLNAEVDPVGVLQRITVPFCNYGRRTLLKNVCRLMPGERLKWRTDTHYLGHDFDNSLCKGLVDIDVDEAAKLVWDRLQKDVKSAFNHESKVAIAMSGGWDSRLVLGAMPCGNSITCLTYGGDDLYETQIARRCSEAVGASHKSFPIENKYFPGRQQIEPLIKETESANYFEWFGIIETSRSGHERLPLLLGDLCESIDGRYMTAYSGRKARVNSVLRGAIGGTETFSRSSDAVFDSWCDDKRREIRATLLTNVPHLSEELRAAIDEKQLSEEIVFDLDLSFARVRDNQPLFEAMYDELFIWFHRIRFLLGNQITWLGSAFQPVSPCLSMRFLRLITAVHPRLKIRKRLMNAIVRLPEFEALALIPSAQVPFVSSRAPGLIKDAVWAARFCLDQILIKRNLRNKKGNGRQRVLPSLDYVKEYRRSESASNVVGWFSGRYINAERYLRIFRDRAALNSWTLINVDIAAPANVSIILDLCSPEISNWTTVHHHQHANGGK
ncbi:MAG: hypothetical protein ABL984_00860 [Pyrinomonadaceae bacterium]